MFRLLMHVDGQLEDVYMSKVQEVHRHVAGTVSIIERDSCRSMVQWKRTTKWEAFSTDCDDHGAG